MRWSHLAGGISAMVKSLPCNVAENLPDFTESTVDEMESLGDLSGVERFSTLSGKEKHVCELLHQENTESGQQTNYPDTVSCSEQASLFEEKISEHLAEQSAQMPEHLKALFLEAATRLNPEQQY